MKANEIRTMKDEEAIFIMTNRLPIKLKMKPYFKNSLLNKHTGMTAYKVGSNKNCDKVEYLDLKYDELI